PHQALIRPTSRFWISSGLDLSVGSQGVKLDTQSLQTLLSGGIVFETSKSALARPESPAGASFRLYPTQQEAEAAGEPVQLYYRPFFPGPGRGLAVDSPVELRGRPIGRVSAIRLEYDEAAQSVRVPVTIEISPYRIHLAGEAVDEPLGDAAEMEARTNRML